MYRLTFHFLALLVFVNFTLESHGTIDPYRKIKGLWSTYSSSENDSLKIALLAQIANVYYDVLNQNKVADSIGDVAISIAGKTPNRILTIIALNNYAEAVDIERWNYGKTRDYIQKALSMVKNTGRPDLEWRTLDNLVKVYLSASKYDSGLVVSFKALELAKALENERFLIKSHLDIGACMEGLHKKIEALHQFQKARELSEEMNDRDLLKKAYTYLSNSYAIIKVLDKALEFKQKQQVLILTASPPIDSTELMWSQFDKHIVINRYNKYLLNGENLESIIDFAIRTNNNRLKKYTFALYNKQLIDIEDMHGYYELYNVKYPQELSYIATHDTTTYFRLKSFFMQEVEKLDSADYYFQKAEERVIMDDNRLFIANFFIRFGQFLRRENRIDESIGKFMRAYQLAESSAFAGKMEYMLMASNNLSDLYALKGDFKNAFYYSLQNIYLTDAIFHASNAETANRMSLEYKIKFENAKKDAELKQRQAERNMVAAGAGVLFLVVLLVFRNYRNQKRLNRLLDAAKKKSEDLLLNILPYETAEELKLTGTAKAKEFDEVTVMFTDFKNFTQASELLSAEKLVEKIHFYFSEFDKIIEKHGLEKIKIIGDSYMCAGGLPVSNTTHAFDVVNAALDLQRFMINHKKEQGHTGSFFELRIGIHTGPVVAGIVGTKKFAYDIWGDTVNTASRMESTGEIEKVNISGTTFERVKQVFQCTYRGKIKAKHKGEIDMYFVDGPMPGEFPTVDGLQP